jgi:uncharacterized membrane protein
MGRFVSVVLAGFVVGAPAAPMGRTLDLAPWLALLAALLGALPCFVVALFGMGLIRPRVTAWWSRSHAGRPSRTARRDARTGRAARQARAIIDRFGPAGFGLVGPTVFGTWGAALLGAALGLSRWPLFGWLAGGTVLWSAALLAAADLAIGFLG